MTRATAPAPAARHAPELRAATVLTIVGAPCALVLAVARHAVTRDEDRELALLGFACRVGEGVLGAAPVTSVGLLWLATATGPNAPDPAAATALAALLLRAGSWKTAAGATLFAVGSAAFSYLLLRGRMVPRALAWLGVVGSALLVVGLPLQLAGVLRGAAARLVWIPVAAFELTVAPWLLVKGVRDYPTGSQATTR